MDIEIHAQTVNGELMYVYVSKILGNYRLVEINGSSGSKTLRAAKAFLREAGYTRVDGSGWVYTNE